MYSVQLYSCTSTVLLDLVPVLDLDIYGTVVRYSGLYLYRYLLHTAEVAGKKESG